MTNRTNKPDNATAMANSTNKPDNNEVKKDTAMYGAKLPPICQKCGKELTSPATLNDELVARQTLLDRMAIFLTSKGHNNIVITGKAGTGKTALVQALAHELVSGTYQGLAGRRIVEISLDSLLKDSYTPAERGKMVEKLFEEAEKESLILFIDEGHRLCGGGGNSSSDTIGNIAKPYLTQSDIQVITATTDEEYMDYIEQDKALKRRFERIQVTEPDVNETVDILERVLEKRYNGYTAAKNTLSWLTEAGNRHSHDRCNPDKAISLLDYAVSWVKNSGSNETELTQESVCSALASRFDISKESVMPNLNSDLGSLPSHLAGQFTGWEDKAKELANCLTRTRIHKDSSDKGPLCSAVLTGKDGSLLEAVATATAKEMGFTGNGEVHVIDASGVALSGFEAAKQPYACEEPITASLQKNPHTAIIVRVDAKATLPYVEMNRLKDIVQRGVLADVRNNRASCDCAPVFIIYPGNSNTARRSAIGFTGNSCAADTSSAVPEDVKQFASLLYGNDQGVSPVVCFGAPAADKRQAVEKKLFTSMLAEYAKKAGIDGDISLDASARSEVRRVIASEDAWSGMHRVVEEILTASCKLSGKLNVTFSNGAFAAKPHGALKEELSTETQTVIEEAR